MPTTLRNTDILFNDGSTQSTAGQPTSTALVLSATASASAASMARVTELALSGRLRVSTHSPVSRDTSIMCIAPLLCAPLHRGRMCKGYELSMKKA